MKKITVVDIARMAGVGTSTITRYFNGGSIKKETRDKIKKIVEKYNYVPNSFAKALKGSSSKIIGIIVPSLSSYVSGKTLAYIDKLLKQSDYELLIMNSDFDVTKEREYIEKLYRMNVDGIILVATTMNKSYEEFIASINIPIVVLGQQSDGNYSVEYDDYTAAEEMVKYVYSKGHRKICYLGVNQKDLAVGVNRHNGVEQTCLKLGIEFNFIETNFLFDKTYEIVELELNKILKTSILICATDNIAYAAIKALEKNGIIVGENFSLTGFGDYEASSLLKYPLTTIRFNIKEASKRAVEMVLDLISSKEVNKVNIISFELKKRCSVRDI